MIGQYVLWQAYRLMGVAQAIKKRFETSQEKRKKIRERRDISARRLDRRQICVVYSRVGFKFWVEHFRIFGVLSSQLGPFRHRLY